MLVFLMRQRADAVATMTESKPEPTRRERPLPRIERMEYVDFADE